MCKSLQLNRYPETYFLDKYLRVCVRQLISRENEVYTIVFMQAGNLCRETELTGPSSVSCGAAPQASSTISLVPPHRTEQGEWAGGAGRDRDFVECKTSGLVSQRQPMSLGCLSRRSRARQKQRRIGVFQEVYLGKATSCTSAGRTPCDPSSPEAISTRCLNMKCKKPPSRSWGLCSPLQWPVLAL